MKVSLLTQVAYRDLPEDFEERYESSVTTPYSLVDPKRLQATYKESLDQMMLAARLGFDGLAVTEHGQSSYDMMPNPSLFASTLAYATEAEGLDVAIYPVGRSLGKAKEPIRVAEEYAMIDVMSGGRLVAGFPVGLAYDANLNNGIPPMDTRARFDEALPLILRAWQADEEPFAHNGRFQKHGNVNLWPRPLQQPPPVWITGVGNPATMKFTLENGFGFNYLAWFGAKVTGPRMFKRFYDIADELGLPRNPFQMGFIQSVCVGETDRKAHRDYAEHVEYGFRKGLGSIPLEHLTLPGQIGIPGLKALMTDPGDFGIYPKMRSIGFAELVDAGTVIVGSPDTVVDHLVEVIREFGIGHLFTMLQIGSMPPHLVEQNITLFAEEVLPRLRPIWEGSGFENHWWPDRLGGHPVTRTELTSLAR